MIPAFKRSLRFSAIATSEISRSAVISFSPTVFVDILTLGTSLRRETIKGERVIKSVVNPGKLWYPVIPRLMLGKNAWGVHVGKLLAPELAIATIFWEFWNQNLCIFIKIFQNSNFPVLVDMRFFTVALHLLLIQDFYWNVLFSRPLHKPLVSFTGLDTSWREEFERCQFSA